jgi:hypothetical protein
MSLAKLLTAGLHKVYATIWLATESMTILHVDLSSVFRHPLPAHKSGKWLRHVSIPSGELAKPPVSVTNGIEG